MTDDNIKQKVLALLNEVQAERGGHPYTSIDRGFSKEEALCRAIEQHETYKQKVSDAVEDAFGLQGGHTLHRFIIPKPKPDPLVEVLDEIPPVASTEGYAAYLRAGLDALGLEIREKGQ